MSDNISNVPKHIAIILDGNGRWALKRGKPRTYGHLHGTKNLIDTAKNAKKLGIECMTVFCFSTENWKRPTNEVNYLMTRPFKYLKKYKDKLFDFDVKITVIGRRDRLDEKVVSLINQIELETKDHKDFHLVLAIDYGSLEEIKTAVLNIYKDVKEGKVNLDEINEQMILDNLYTKTLPPLDLLIRTSGELRISNFLLLQLAYSELYFTDCLWPDFNEEELKKAILSYQSRKRRFGAL